MFTSSAAKLNMADSVGEGMAADGSKCGDGKVRRISLI